MSKKNQHVVTNGKDWAIKGAGNEKEAKIVDTNSASKTYLLFLIGH